MRFSVSDTQVANARRGETSNKENNRNIMGFNVIAPMNTTTKEKLPKSRLAMRLMSREMFIGLPSIPSVPRSSHLASPRPRDKPL